MDYGEAIEQAIKNQVPFIFSNPSKIRPGIMEITYDFTTVRLHNCLVSLTKEAREDLRVYLEMLKEKGHAEDGGIRYPGYPGAVIPEYYDHGWLRVPIKEELKVGYELGKILLNPHNWILDEGNETPQAQRMLEAKRKEWLRGTS
jgi:hypothetical protein